MDGRVTAAKLALALAAAIIFAWGIRTDSSTLRVIAIGCLAAAVLLRFIKPRAPRR